MPSNTQIGHGNIAVQIVGDGNTIVAGHPHLLLTRYETDRLSAEDIAEREPTQLLAARQRAIPTIGRDPLLNEYEAWLNNDAAISVRVLVGSAGRGKTRFGLDLCDRATTSDWQTGFATSAEIRRFRAQQNLAGWGWSKPVLLVVDYASSVSEELHGWLAELAQNHNPADPDVPTPPLRILLLDRTADASGGWLQMVYGRGGGDRDSIERLLDRPEPYVLPPIADMEDRRQLLTEMLAAQGTELLPPAAGEDAWFDQRLAELSWGGEPLFLMMAASLAAREDFASVLALARDDMALRIADDELARIDRIISTTDQPPAFVHHMVAMVTLCGGLNATLALEVIAEEEEALHHRLPSGPASCLELLQRVLPKIKNRLAPIEPDMIGEAILMRVWADVDDAAISQTLKRASDNKDCRAAIGETVIRAAQDYAIHGHVAPLVWLDALGASAANDLFILFELLDALPAETVELRERALSLTEKALDVLRKLPVDDEVYSQLLAGTLNNLSNRLVGLGRREDALAAIEEAVRIRRELAAARPDAFLPNLAMSLNNLSGCLDGLGRREDALAAIEEAVRIRRERAAARPDVFLPDLATSLNNLSNRLDSLGRREDALAAIEEAVRIRRELAAARPDAFLPNLAMSLNNLSGSLDGMGRREDALAAIEEAARIYRDLAAARPDAFLPDLAGSLNNLSGSLDGLGRQEDALVAIEEAVRIYRELSAARPDAFLPDLAMSLNNLSGSLGGLGRREDALVAIEEAVRIYRELAAARPDAFLPDLAMSLNNLSGSLDGLGRREEALAAIEEAVRIYRELAAARPDAFLPDLATSCGMRGQILHRSEMQREAMASFEEGIRTLRELFLKLPDAFIHLMGGLFKDYSNSAQEINAELDEELLMPIFEKMQEIGALEADT